MYGNALPSRGVEAPVAGEPPTLLDSQPTAGQQAAVTGRIPIRGPVNVGVIVVG